MERGNKKHFLQIQQLIANYLIFNIKTSNLNYMLYVRGLPQDYEAWANMTGDDNWSYNNLLPYFKKGLHYDGKYKNDGIKVESRKNKTCIIHQIMPRICLLEKHYGSSAYGTLNVEARSWSPLSNYFIEAAEELGIKNLDINAPQRTGKYYKVHLLV